MQAIRTITKRLNKPSSNGFCWANRSPSVFAQVPCPTVISDVTAQKNTTVVHVVTTIDEKLIAHPLQREQLVKSKQEWHYATDVANQLNLVSYVGTPTPAAGEVVAPAVVEENTSTVLLKKQNQFLTAGAKTARALHSRKIIDADITFDAVITSTEASNFLRGMLLANYKFFMHGQTDESKLTEEQKSSRFTPLATLNLLLSPNLADLHFIQRAAYYTLYARQLGNLRGDIANTEFFLQECKDILAANPRKVVLEYLKGDELVQNGLNLIYAVGKASANPPILANLTYRGDPSKDTIDVALIGKGVCFDAGGLNIKPTGSMETMYMDKAGAVATLTTFKAAVELGLKVNITVTVGLVENFLANNSYRPSDIIRSHKGLTVEIGNTDAEGRLVLADCMSWTQAKHSPKTMIELSTLTGACVVALGDEQAGLFSNSDSLSSQLLEAGAATGDSLWRMPINDNHREAMKGTYSDLSNSGKGRWAGASKAAAFLENFVDKNVQWAHIDIAGPAEATADKGHLTSGMTGFGVQLLLNYLKGIQQK